MSSHLGMILLVIVGAVTVASVIVIAAIEARRMDKGKPPILSSKKQDQQTDA